MGRVRFKKGEQRAFFDSVIERLKVGSLRGILQFGFEISYSTLKNYYTESRLLSEDLFDELLEVSGILKKDLEFEILNDNWGRTKGGRISKRRKIYNN
jgi:hypothetical protein